MQSLGVIADSIESTFDFEQFIKQVGRTSVSYENKLKIF